MSDNSISLNQNDFEVFASSLGIIPGIIMPSSDESYEKISAFGIWEDVLAQENSTLPLTALNHSRIFQRVELLLHPHQSLKLQAEFTRLESKLSPESVVLVVDGIAWDRIVGDIIDLFQGHGIVVDPLVIGDEDEYIAFVYVKDQQAAQLAMGDLNGATILEDSGDPKDPDSFVVGLRMATYGDIKHCLLMKGLQFNQHNLQFSHALQ